MRDRVREGITYRKRMSLVLLGVFVFVSLSLSSYSDCKGTLEPHYYLVIELEELA